MDYQSNQGSISPQAGSAVAGLRSNLLPPINREDGGQTQLQEQNGAVSAVPQPTYPAINIPDVITPDFFNRPPSADRQRIENDLQTRRQEYMTSFQQTQREQQLQQETLDLDTQLTNLRQSEAKGQFNIEQQRIAMPLITGQQAALQRQAQLERGDVLAQLESKQKALGFEVAKREGIMAKAKAAIGFAESDLDRIGKLEQNQFEREKFVLDYAQKLGDNARQTLGTILSKFEGMGWNDLSEQARTGLANLAAQAGIDPFIIAQGLETQKDSMAVKQEKDRLENEKIKKELGLPPKLETSITEAGGRRLLINDQTGEVIKDLGVSELPKVGGTGGGTANKITATEAKTFNLPLSMVGMSEEQVFGDLDSPEPPQWFIEKMENELRQSLLPVERQKMWDEFRTKTKQEEPTSQTEQTNEDILNAYLND